MLKVWGRRSSCNVQKVMWLLAELGLAHEHFDAGGRFGGLDDPKFRAMNPHGLVPVIDDESNSVVWMAKRTWTFAASSGMSRCSVGMAWTVWMER